jgi:hypothetical protein
VGPTLEPVYRHPRPYYLVQAPKYSARFDMLSGLLRYLADPDGTVRLDGAPLFTLSDGQQELLFEGTTQAFTWPTTSPASLTAHAYDRVRWTVSFLGDRIVMHLDPAWTRFEKAQITVPGKWLCPSGVPRWRRVVSVDADGREAEGPPPGTGRVAAAELEFPGGHWNLALAFEPAEEAILSATGLSFPMGSLGGDRWSIGFCAPGTLDAWRGARPSPGPSRP